MRDVGYFGDDSGLGFLAQKFFFKQEFRIYKISLNDFLEPKAILFAKAEERSGENKISNKTGVRSYAPYIKKMKQENICGGKSTP